MTIELVTTILLVAVRRLLLHAIALFPLMPTIRGRRPPPTPHLHRPSILVNRTRYHYLSSISSLSSSCDKFPSPSSTLENSSTSSSRSTRSHRLASSLSAAKKARIQLGRVAPFSSPMLPMSAGRTAIKREGECMGSTCTARSSRLWMPLRLAIQMGRPKVQVSLVRFLHLAPAD